MDREHSKQHKLPARLHPLESLGVVRASSGEIRVENLVERIRPRVPFPHRHDFFQIVVIVASTGAAWHEIDFERHRISNGQIFIIKPGQVHSWSLRPRTQGFVIEFTHESLILDFRQGPNLLAQLSHIPDVIKLKDRPAFRRFEILCETMRQEFLERKDQYEACIRSYLSGALIQLLRETRTHSQKSPQAPSSDETLHRLKQLIEASFTQEHGVTFYAKKLGLSPKALTMRLSRILDKSPRELIQDRCLLEAKRLLAYTSLSVSEVGYALGFEDPNYFVRFFRQHSQITPARFRSRATSDTF